MYEKHRRRRIIYNDDSDQQYVGYESYRYSITDDQSFIDTRTTPVFDTHVDTYVWCVGNGCDPPWGGHASVRECLGSTERATELIVNACHDHDLEVWGSLRMNDIHDSFMADSLDKADDPLKSKHPEYLVAPPDTRKMSDTLTERYLWTAFNYARPEVRQYRLDFIARNASAHAFDGYELDFTRMPWCFPLGEERDHLDDMTDLIAQVRRQLNSIGQERGVPYTFAVHVGDSPAVALELGLDVETWVAKGLVDVLIVGMGYMPFVLRIDQWQAIAKPHGISVYPAMNTLPYEAWYAKKLGRPEAWHEAIRAGACYFWQSGADGIYLFNLFCQEDQSLASVDKESVYAPLREVGDPQVLADTNKLYSIQPSSASWFCHHASEAAPMPVPLNKMERKLPLQIGADADDANAQFTIRLSTTGRHAGRRLQLRLNHRLLTDPFHDDEWYWIDIPPGLMRKGYNELTIFASSAHSRQFWANWDESETEDPIIVHQVFVEVKH